MAFRRALLCLLGMLIASSAIAVSDSGIYYQIGLMWPGAYCVQTTGGCCMPKSPIVPAADFYVSGFTVFNATTDAPETSCSSTPFNSDEILEISGLRQYWSNIKCPSNNGQKSWKSAWKTSGVCSGLDDKAYFQAAIALRSKINPLSRLVSKGIKPDFGLYSLEKIKKAIQVGTGVAPLIQCSEGPFDKFQLYQIFICVAEDAKTLIECPKPQKFTCSDEILFHPFKKWMLKQAASSVSFAEAFEMAGAAMGY
ncbi:ribonuclease 1-like [Hordeum vulgare subsp. vulgare]|uniref:Uncharacterized protein n=1 Tax=Hordeum vulgare subsp. vulgare TaxID=112509 RepID=A0A8I6WYW6_HORVV|nr:ribonuclease 1-like [Hordeum vulgare subsp. vulgare]XP_044984936.1 ribonuclease 1-like [Hordeum vulgare subsp. vulgare]